MILAKLQKHQNFEAEIQANEVRLNQIRDSGKKLIDRQHFQSPSIRDRLTELEGYWKKLTEREALKGAHLRHANEEQQFIRNVEDFEIWLTEVEGQLASEDFVRDLNGVQAAEKRQHMLEADYAARQDRLDQFKSQAEKFQESGMQILLCSLTSRSFSPYKLPSFEEM